MNSTLQTPLAVGLPVAGTNLQSAKPTENFTPLRALLVEDSRGDAEQLLRALRQAGFTVTSERVETVPTLKKALRRTGWDIVFSDFQMPECTGMETLAIVHSSKLDLPFIMISSVGSEATAVDAMRAGAKDFLLKDRLERLGPAVRRELAEAAARREHRKTAAALQESESNFRLLFEQAGDGFEVFNEQGRLVDVNAVACRDLGYRREELLDLHQWDIDLQSRREHYAETFAALAEGRASNTVESVYRRKDGTVFSVEISTSVIQLDRCKRQLLLVRDITERKRADARIREQASLLDKVNDAIYVHSPTGMVTYWSAGAERLFGWTGAEALGHALSELNVLGPDPDGKRHRDLNQNGCWTEERTQQNKLGKELAIFTRLTLVKDGSGQLTSIIAIATDVTASKLIKEQLLHVHVRGHPNQAS